MNESPTPKYVVALRSDEYEDEGTLHTFTDPDLWDWIHAETTFPHLAKTVTASIPGTTRRAALHVGYSRNDRAQALVTHRQGIGLSEVVHVDYQETLARLTDEVGAANVYSGRRFRPTPGSIHH
jgi:hypothetical protein